MIEKRTDQAAPLFGFDAYSPPEIAARVTAVGVAKCALPTLTLTLMMLGALAGAFIGLGGLYYTLVASDTTLSFAAARVLGGVVFSLGLVFVVVAGAELFTGNNLVAMAWASRQVSYRALLRAWSIAFVSNAAGAFALAMLVSASGYADMNGGAVGLAAVKIAATKTALPFWEAFVRGILCNVLVCLGVWLSIASRSVTDKVLAVVFPISAFVAAGFEHSVANMYFIPLGLLLRDSVDAAAVTGATDLTWAGYARNLLPVTLGNILGGSGLVALVYWVIYKPTQR